MNLYHRIFSIFCLPAIASIAVAAQEDLGEDWRAAVPGCTRAAILQHFDGRIIGEYPNGVTVGAAVLGRSARLFVGFSEERVVSLLYSFNTADGALELFSTIRRGLPGEGGGSVAVKIDGVVLIGDEFQFERRHRCEIVYAVQDRGSIYQLSIGGERASEIGSVGVVLLEVSAKVAPVVD